MNAQVMVTITLGARLFTLPTTREATGPRTIRRCIAGIGRPVFVRIPTRRVAKMACFPIRVLEPRASLARSAKTEPCFRCGSARGTALRVARRCEAGYCGTQTTAGVQSWGGAALQTATKGPVFPTRWPWGPARAGIRYEKIVRRETEESGCGLRVDDQQRGPRSARRCLPVLSRAVRQGVLPRAGRGERALRLRLLDGPAVKRSLE